MITNRKGGDDFDDLNNTLKSDFNKCMNEAEQASKAAAAKSQVPKIALDSNQKKNKAKQDSAKNRIERNYLQDVVITIIIIIIIVEKNEQMLLKEIYHMQKRN